MYYDGNVEITVDQKKKLITGITAPGSVNLLRGQLKYFHDQGFESYLIAPDESTTKAFCEDEKCTLLPVKIKREISLISDFIALWVITKHFWKIKPDIVNAGTPKMSLLAMIASRILGVKRRIYTCRGFRYEHEKGLKRKVLMFMEQLTGLLAQDIICISPSVKEMGIKDRIFKAEKCHVINKGSSNGIDIQRFSSEKVDIAEISELKKQLKITDKFVFGFVGRLIDRKGIAELYDAFIEIYRTDRVVRLLIVGTIEFEQITDKKLVDKLRTHPGIIMPGRTDIVPLYLSVMDVFVLPAWWEGFGNVLVEAAAMGIPVISTLGTGCRDAVRNGYNGILVKPKDYIQLEQAMLKLKLDSRLRKQMGLNGIEWAKNFNNKIIWEGMHKLYRENK